MFLVTFSIRFSIPSWQLPKQQLHMCYLHNYEHNCVYYTSAWTTTRRSAHASQFQSCTLSTCSQDACEFIRRGSNLESGDSRSLPLEFSSLSRISSHLSPTSPKQLILRVRSCTHFEECCVVTFFKFTPAKTFLLTLFLLFCYRQW